MKIYRIIVIVLALILGISFSTFLFFFDTTQTAINDPVTEEYYEFLKANSLKVAKTLDKSVLNDETLTADFYFSQDELIVIVESMKAKITAKIPISNHSLNIEDETIKCQGLAEFENVKYEEENKLQPAWWYILMSIIGGIAVAVLVYLSLFKAWFSSPENQ